MTANNNRYSKFMIALHWITAVLVVAAYLFSEDGEEVRAATPVLHFAFGLGVLLLVVPRLIVRAMSSVLPLENTGGKWMTRAAKWGHGALYVLLIAVPVTGWYAASRLGAHISMLGFALPPIAVAVEGEPGLLAELHPLGGNLILVLAGLHAAMALWHHFVRHDNTLRRMSPF
jgi:cytochrome b561